MYVDVESFKTPEPFNKDKYLNAQGLLFITDNGSYILPNGIIMLVEVDIDKFLNNELVFYFREVEQK